MKDDKRLEAIIFRVELLYLSLEEFIGFARIMGVDIEESAQIDGFEEIRHIRNDFDTIEELMVEKYLKLDKNEKNKVLRRLRQITKYHKNKSGSDIDGEQNL